jgi:chromosome segregation ATPase
MMDLRLFMTERQKAIREEYEPLLERRKALRAEFDEVTKKLTLLKKELDEIEKAEQAIASTEAPTQKIELTIKEAVLKVLEDERRGMTAQQILVAINERFFDGSVVRSSLSPQLSRLNHKDKKIKFNGTLWSLRSGDEEGSAIAEPSFLE